MKKIFILMLCILSFGVLKNVYAKTETLVMEYANTPYYLRQGEGGVTTSKLAYYNLDGDVAYCIEPGIHITDSKYVEITLDNANLSNDVLNKIRLIGYYGYEYPNHQTDNYRLATQSLIWETVKKLTVIYSTEKNGKGTIIDVSNEKNEIMKLVNNHLTLPNISNNLILSINEDNIIEDNNNVLSQFDIINNNDNLKISKEGNKLHIYSNNIGDYSITLRKQKYDNKGTFLYVGSDGISQKLMKLRHDDNIELNINIHIVGGKLFLNKLDFETKTNKNIGDSKLSNAHYGIYDENNNLIEELVTNNKGEIVSNYLKFGKYYVKEIKASYGYLLDNKKYDFLIDKDNLNKKLDVYEELDKKEVTILKTIEGDYSVLNGEKNITFEIYFKNTNILYKTITTNKDGLAKIKLPFGSYTFHQVNTSNGFLKSDDFDVLINENINNIYKVVYDKRVRGNLEIIKKDLENGIVLKDAFIEVYKDNKLVYSGYTDDSGKILLNDLYVGSYKIIEKQAPTGYILDEKEYFVDITNDKYNITLEITNKKKEIIVPNTSLNNINTLKYSGIGIMILGLISIMFRKKIRIN